ncbi:hypothetical protein LINPERHAP1_LOCUS17670, partial [Linum perenne]
EIILTIWNNIVEDFKTIIKGKDLRGTVILITSTFVNLFQGKYNISASSATKIIVEPDIPDPHHIKQGTIEQESQKLTQNNNIAPTQTDIEEVT